MGVEAGLGLLDFVIGMSIKGCPLTETPQDLYYPDDHETMPGWFKGMEQIICEQGLWPDCGLNTQHTVSRL